MGVKLSSFFSGGGVLLNSQKIFLAAVSFIFAATGLSGVFINTFIYSCVNIGAEAASALRTVVYYNLCMYASMAFFSIVIGIIGKNTNSRTLISFGIALQATVFILLIALREKSIGYVWLMGILSGMASSLINLNYGVAVGRVTSKNNREYYLFLQGEINAICTLASPLVAGAVLEMIGGINGYTVLFSVSLALTLAGLFCFFNLHFNDGKKGMTQFGNVFVAFIKNKTLRGCAVAELVGGLRDGIAAFLIPILLFSIDMSNMWVGIYIFMTSLVQAFFSRRLQSKINQTNRSLMLFASCFLCGLVGLAFLSGTGILQIFSYGIVSAFLQSIYAAAVFSIFFEASYKIKNAHRKNLEILSVKEFYANIGRLIGVFVLLVVSHDTANIVYTIIGVGIVQIAAWVFMHKSSREAKKLSTAEESITIKLG